MEAVQSGLLEGTVITSRIRLARNLQNFNFCITNPQLAKDVVKKVYRALVKTDTFNLYFASNLSDLVLEGMKERHLISNALIKNKQFGAALINEKKDVSVMVHEEDVIREQCFMKGLCLSEAYKRISAIDDAISKNLDLAFDHKLGYLTACPTNLGTGLRASVMLFLPALTEGGKINALAQELSQLGLTIRGIYGEGTKAEGFTYQVSNEVTLGVSEYEILRSVEEAVIRICKAEREEKDRLYSRKQLKTMDKARKAFGILTNSVLLGYEEFLSLVAQVKLGAMLGMINISDISQIDDLIVMVRPAVLCEQYQRKLSAIDRDLFRAEIVSNKLLKIKE